MKKETTILLLTLILLPALPQNFFVYAAEERKVLSRKLTGIDVEIYAPYQCYPGDTITLKAKVEATEEARNVTITVFVMGSKSEGYDTWTFSFKFLDLVDLSAGAVRNETYYVTTPTDISPGLTYGKTIFQWITYRSASWEEQSHEGLFRLTYIGNKDYENLQDQHNSVQSELQVIRTLMYTFSATTIALAISTVYLARKKPKANRNDSSK